MQELSPFLLSEVHHVADGARLTHHVEPPQACVRVAGVEGLEAMAQVSLAGHLSQFTGQILGSHNIQKMSF